MMSAPFKKVLWGLLVGLGLLVAGPAVAQEYYEYLPDTLGSRLLRQAHVQHLLWTVEDLRYNSRSPYREYTFDSRGRELTSRLSNGPVTYARRYNADGLMAEITEAATPGTSAGPSAGALAKSEGAASGADYRPAKVLRYDERKRLLLELSTRAQGGFDTLTTYRYVQRGDTAWQHTTGQYGGIRVERSFHEDHGRVLRYDQLQYRHSPYSPEQPLYLDKIESYYSRTDDKGRPVESGKVSYQLALEGRRGQGVAKRQHVPGFRETVHYDTALLLLLNGKLRGEYQPTKRLFYDGHGRMSATWSRFAGLHRFSYNASGQVTLIEFITQAAANGPPGAPEGSAQFTWGPAGLPIRVERRNANGEPDQISTYTYSHFN